MMSRQELTEKIAAGSAFLQRTDITEDQVERAKAKLDSYREMLRNIGDEESSKEKAQRNIEAIRTMLNKKLGRVRNEPSDEEQEQRADHA
jgi:hypothetical protein